MPQRERTIRLLFQFEASWLARVDHLHQLATRCRAARVLQFYPSVSQPELSFYRPSWPLLVDLLARFTSKDRVPMPGPEDDFEPNKALLNPFFESYRLESDVLDLQEVATFKAAAAPIGRVLQGGDG